MCSRQVPYLLPYIPSLKSILHFSHILQDGLTNKQLFGVHTRGQILLIIVTRGLMEEPVTNIKPLEKTLKKFQRIKKKQYIIGIEI